MLYPVRLLGSTVQVPTLRAPPVVPLQEELDIDLLAAGTWKRLQVIRKCHNVASRALSIMVGGQGAHFDILLFGALTAADVLKWAARDSYHLRDVLIAIFEKAISRMRGILNESGKSVSDLLSLTARQLLTNHSSGARWRLAERGIAPRDVSALSAGH